MQFIRHQWPKQGSLLVRSMSTHAVKEPKPARLPRYTPQNQQILDETMIPGPCLRFFKTKRERKRPENGPHVRMDTLPLYY